MIVYICTMLISMLILYICNNMQKIKELITIKISVNKNENENKNIVEDKAKVFWAAIPFIIVASIRSFVGTDYTTYYYRQIPDTLYGNAQYLEKGFQIFIKTIIYIFKDYQFVYIFTAIIIVLGFFYFFKEFSVNIYFTIFLFLTNYSFNQSLNIMRQYIATSFFLIALVFLKKRKYIWYIILCLIACSFHTVAIIYLIIPIIQKFDFRKKYTPFIFIFIIIFNKYISNIIIIICIKIGFYNNYFESTYSHTSSSSNALLVLNGIVFLIATYLVDNKNDWEGKLYYSMEIIILVALSVSSSVPFVSRIVSLFSPVVCVYVPYIVKNIKYNKIRKIAFIFFVFLFSAFFIYYVGVSNTGETLPYKTIFSNTLIK